MSRHLPIPYRHADKPATVESIRIFDAWDDEQRRQRGFWAGLRLFSNLGKRHIYIASRHWPHLLCWQWILTLDILPFRPRLLEFKKLGPGANGGLSWSFRFLWLFSLCYRRQASDRIPALGLREAPRVYYGPKAAA